MDDCPIKTFQKIVTILEYFPNLNIECWLVYSTVVVQRLAHVISTHLTKEILFDNTHLTSNLHSLIENFNTFSKVNF
jgi:hypothetical protein